MSKNDPSFETAQGRDIAIRFDGNLCIHSRFCVLQAPAVFKANTPGEWIIPDAMDAAALAAVARNCPSGAITYRAKNHRLDEVDPPVNTIRLRENGPYAVNAHLEIAGADIAEPVRRRTLCRCGASRNKPYCDGSHAKIGFEASGEPPTAPHHPLDARNGTLTIRPIRDGPLEVSGSVEIVSGTGRTIATTTQVLLCRCGGSHNKPFCDGTHSLNGFTDGPDREPLPPGEAVPPIAEWIGGPDKLQALTTAFYSKLPDDPLLAPVFAHKSPNHAERVADFLVELFGGPPRYSSEGGSHIGMVVKHMGRAITEEQRARWVELMIETADEVGLPANTAFRETFVNYLEWGSKLAVINSAPGIEEPKGDWPMPKWGWGPARAPGDG